MSVLPLQTSTLSRRIYLGLCAVFIALQLNTTLFGQASAQNKTSENHVIIISLDGLAAYLVDDPKAALPTVRRLAKEGAIVSGGMKVSNPSVTWPNHTTLIAGVRPEKHGVLANGVLVRGGPGVPIVVDPKRDRKDLVQGVTIVDLAHAAGLRTAEINWPCTRGSNSYDDSFPDVPESVKHSTARLRSELIAKELLDDDTDASFAKKVGAVRDHVWTEAAAHVIRERKPNLLLIHLLNVDTTHHAEGPQTPAGYTANAYADMCLDRIVRATEEAGIKDRTTFFVVSDHGFISTPKAIKPNMVLKKEGLLKSAEGKITEARMHVFPEGGTGLVYCTNPGEAAELTKRFAELMKGREGVVDVVLPDRFAELGLPLPREYQQAPDAVLVAAAGFAVSSQSDGEEFVVENTDAKTALGSHGFVATLAKMNGLCVISGYGIKKNVQLQNIENIDIAPTIAHLLNIKNFNCDGKPLQSALAP